MNPSGPGFRVQGGVSGMKTPGIKGTPGESGGTAGQPNVDAEQAAKLAGDIAGKVVGGSSNEPQVGEQVAPPKGKENSNNNEENNVENNNGPKARDKVGAGLQVGKDGKVEEDDVQRLQNVAAEGAAAYFSGGNAQAMQAARGLSKSNLGRKTSEQLSRNRVIRGVAKEANESGATDVAEGALQGFSAIQNKDIDGVKESAKKIVKGSKKAKEKQRKKILIALGIYLVQALALITVLVVIMGPVIGGVMELVDTVESFGKSMIEGVNNAFDEIGNIMGGGNLSQEEIDNIIKNNIPNFESLDEYTQKIVTTALSITGHKYSFGEGVTGPGLSGLSSEGIDCSAYVQWVLWTATGKNPSSGRLTTQAISDSIGKSFVQISEADLRPGDIGLKRLGGSDADNGNYNHTGIYVGNGTWAHASSSGGVKANNYKGFTIYLRYTGA